MSTSGDSPDLVLKGNEDSYQPDSNLEESIMEVKQTSSGTSRKISINSDQTPTSPHMSKRRTHKSHFFNVKSRYSTCVTFGIHTKYGLISCLKILIGSTIGSGIFTSSSEILMATNNDILSLCVWFGYGLIALLGCLCYVELGTTFPVSAGEYAYLNEIFGDTWGFLYQWTSTVVFVPMISAGISEAIAYYLIIPYFFDSSEITENEDLEILCCRIVATVIILFISYAICTGPQAVDKLEKATFTLKFIMIITLILCGMYNSIKHGIYRHTNFTFDSLVYLDDDEDRGYHTSHIPTNLMLAIYETSYSYLGVNTLNYVTEEVRDPTRMLPAAALISLPLIIVVYTLINFFYFVSLPPDVIKKSEFLAIDLVQTVLPDSAKAITAWAIPTAVAFSILGTLSIHITASARVAFVGGRNHHVPKALAVIQLLHRTPVVTIMITSCIACLYFWFLEFNMLFELSSQLEQAAIGITVFALIYMRIKRPELRRPFKLPLFLPILYVIFSAILYCTPFIIAIADYFDESSDKIRFNTRKVVLMVSGICLVSLGIPVYYGLVRPKQLPNWASKLDLILLNTAQKFFIAGQDQKL